MDDLVIAGQVISSRLSVEITDIPLQVVARLVTATGCALVTQTRRMAETGPVSKEGLHIRDIPSHLRYVPNTHGCASADEAIALAHAIRRAGLSDWIKLEVTPDPRHYMSDGTATLKAAEQLVRDGFTVLPYMHADPLLAKRLEEGGCATVMPPGAPIGSGKGLQTREVIEMSVAEVHVPVIVDAGMGRPSHATEAMEIGADAVIVHTALRKASDPVLTAQAFKAAVATGRLAFLAA